LYEGGIRGKEIALDHIPRLCYAGSAKVISLQQFITREFVMKHRHSVVFLFVCALFITSVLPVNAAPPAKEADAPGCSDHPLFTRMLNMRLVLCKTIAFDSAKFKTGKGTESVVEGRRFDIKYQTLAGSDYPGALAIIRNHQQAITKIGGTVLFEDQRYTWLKIAKDGKEIWAQVDSAWNAGYQIFIIEKAGMAQEIVASAEAFSNDLKDTGHAAVYGIYFDTGQAVVKPESEAALEQIAKLLKGDPSLKVNVVGHTDNVGTIEANMKLSQARAAAVVAVLTSKHGIAALRLKAYGVGPLAPVASNKSDDGKAKNRRVELVEQ
jgi:OOP family OmpA-OmpF porin